MDKGRKEVGRARTIWEPKKSLKHKIETRDPMPDQQENQGQSRQTLKSSRRMDFPFVCELGRSQGIVRASTRARVEDDRTA